MATKPRFHRSAIDHVVGWEIYDWRQFFVNISIGNFELQINKWKPSKKEKGTR
jgi:hypothetical protein